MAPRAPARGWGPIEPGLDAGCAAASALMDKLEDIFDDANGDLAIGELEGAVEKCRPLRGA